MLAREATYLLIVDGANGFPVEIIDAITVDGESTLLEVWTRHLPRLINVSMPSSMSSEKIVEISR
jgi:hypothetical protein